MTSAASRLRPLDVFLWLAIVLGTVARLAFVAHPADSRTQAPWRESDYAQIARSFEREGMNPLYPRVDWREDTSGHVEMELPILPWSAALFYRLFGHHEEILRVLSALASVATLIAFARLAHQVVEPRAALFATAAFAANGLLISLSGGIQPEPVLLLFTVLAAGAIHAWSSDGRTASLLAAGALTGAAILAKASAAHLGLVLAWFVLARFGRRALRQPAVYAAAILALLPGLLWYAWAHRHYLDTGLSLGLSNETHLVNLELLRHPRPALVGNATAELRDGFSIFGIALAACALALPWRRLRFAVVWYASVLVFYALSADTSGDGWAFYYHSLSVAPACLLAALGFEALTRESADRPRRVAPAVASALAVLLILSAAGRGAQLVWRAWHQRELDEQYRCLRELAEHVPPAGRIVVRGWSRFDAHGHPVAYNESMAFTWMDRKGFNYAREDFGLAELEAIAARGGRYWVAQPADLGDAATRSEVEERYLLLAECSGFLLYDLTLPPVR